MSWPNLNVPNQPRGLAARLAWLALIWALSVGALGLVAMIIRWAVA